MKKSLFVLLIAFSAMFAVKADDGFGFGVWYDLPGEITGKSIDGIGLGLPVIANNKTSGASLALCGNDINKMDGFQFVLFGVNFARTLEGVQLGLINMFRSQHGDCAMQWGLYNQAGRNGIQIGLFNNGQNNASFQLGFLNINKNGLLPIMIFINFGTGLFD